MDSHQEREWDRNIYTMGKEDLAAFVPTLLHIADMVIPSPWETLQASMSHIQGLSHPRAYIDQVNIARAGAFASPPGWLADTVRAPVREADDLPAELRISPLANGHGHWKTGGWEVPRPRAGVYGRALCPGATWYIHCTSDCHIQGSHIPPGPGVAALTLDRPSAPCRRAICRGTSPVWRFRPRATQWAPPANGALLMPRPQRNPH